MREGWKEVLLGDISEIYSGYAFKSTEMQNESSDAVPLIKIKNINDRKVLNNFDSYLSNKYILNKYNKYKLLQGDFLIAMTGQGSVGRIGKMHNVDKNYYVNQRVGIVRVNENIANREFVFQQVATPHNELVYYNLAMGAGQPNLSPNDIGNLKIQLPRLQTQRKIASILSSYDDLIENNLKRIKLLEEKAQLTYEEWFVKMRFPGYETAKFDKVTGLPEGWEKVKLGTTGIQMIDGDRGKNYPKQDEFSKDGYCLFLNTGNVTNTGFQFQNVQFISSDKDQQLRKGKVSENDIILTTRGTIGNVALYNSLIDYKNVRINSGMLILRCTDSHINYHYFYQTLISEHFQSLLKTFSYGAAQPQLPIGTIVHLDIIKPSIELQNEFSELMDVSIKVTYRLNNQNRLLKEARDILLPRLMSGMIDVEEISGQVGEEIKLIK